MGYNFLSGGKIPRAVNTKLNDFLSSLSDAINKGKNITFADRDISYILSLWHERIKSKGIELEYDFHSGEGGNKFWAISDWQDGHYESKVCSDSRGIKRVVKKSGKILYKDDKKSFVYETVTDVINGAHPDEDSYCCPSCGRATTIADLQNGCSYCGTKFQMDDLFPKISSFYFLDDPSLAKGEFRSLYFKVYAVTLFLYYFLACMVYGDIFLPENLFKDVTHMLIGLTALIISNFLAAYFGTIFFLFIRAMVKSIVSLRTIGTVGSRGNFEYRMKKISPEFSYEYFTSKAISLIKTAIFSEDECELMFYEGDALDPGMKDIIDINYAGALGCRKFVDEGNFVTVTTKAYFDVMYASGEKVYCKSQAFSAIFRRRTDIPVNFNFSMTRIACPSCGASFDATKIKNCPYCGNKYDIITDDWTLIELKY